MSNSDWDLDLRAGLEGEQKLADLLSADTIEIKTDRRWHETGNIYVETSCYYQGTNDWRISGMNISEATHWAFMLEDSVLIVPLFRLREAVYELGKPISCNIQPNPSKGFLITPAQILQHIGKARTKEIAAHDEHEYWEDPAERDML